MSDNAEITCPIYVVSGGKGIAGYTMVHSLIIQYPDYNMPVKVIPEVQTKERIEEVVLMVKKTCGVLTHTMVNSNLRELLVNACGKHGVLEIDFMGQLADHLEKRLGLKSVSVPGLYRRVNHRYFDRIEAIEFTLKHDDGLNPNRLQEAEVVLTGVSRAGKTPLSVYMSMFGWKVSNVPLVKGIEPPKELFSVDPNRVFGLSIRPSHLRAQRYKRLKSMNNLDNTDYVDDLKINEEIKYANQIFQKGGFTVIDVTNKPVESSANEILAFISKRFGLAKDIPEENI